MKDMNDNRCDGSRAGKRSLRRKTFLFSFILVSFFLIATIRNLHVSQSAMSMYSTGIVSEMNKETLQQPKLSTSITSNGLNNNLTESNPIKTSSRLIRSDIDKVTSANASDGAIYSRSIITTNTSAESYLVTTNIDSSIAAKAFKRRGISHCLETPSSSLETLKFKTNFTFRDFFVGPAFKLSKRIQQRDFEMLSSYNDSVAVSKQREMYESLKQPDAVCKYRHELLFSDHFPHAMQQLYRCVSWWFAHPNQQPVLLHDWNDTTILSNFMKGFLESIEYAMNVKIVMLSNTSNSTILELSGNETRMSTLSPKYSLADNPFVQLRHFQSYVMLRPKEDAAQLRQKILQYYNITETNQIIKNEMLRTSVPRIAILDRTKREKRNILNVQLLASEIQKAFNLPYDVPIQYFSNKTYLEQVSFFAMNDIIISPHGAQLTGIPFMPPLRRLNSNYDMNSTVDILNKDMNHDMNADNFRRTSTGADGCSTVLEIFPKNYYLPSFFGTLANVSNVQYYYLYLSNVSGEKEYSKFTSTKEDRLKARLSSLCVPTPTTLNAVRFLYDSWINCRKNGTRYK